MDLVYIRTATTTATLTTKGKLNKTLLRLPHQWPENIKRQLQYGLNNDDDDGDDADHKTMYTANKTLSYIFVCYQKVGFSYFTYLQFSFSVMDDIYIKVSFKLEDPSLLDTILFYFMAKLHSVELVFNVFYPFDILPFTQLGTEAGLQLPVVTI
uniref:Uncharacterized protein n=1 Tax=Glossina brevipalpis TaxID=37001 RepID=A0A1A9WF75_9MUSC